MNASRIAAKSLFGLLVLAFSATLTWAQAQPTVVCTETSSGCIADIFAGAFGPDFAVTVASDGESAFLPFGVTFDTSDGIQWGSNFNSFGTWAFIGQPGWVQVVDPSHPTLQTWVLPAVIPGCGSENEPICEPLGDWFLAGQFWVDSVQGTYLILDSAGAVSDTIILNNNGPGGSAQVLFTSDPGPLPEPATLVLLGAGLAGLALSRRRR